MLLFYGFTWENCNWNVCLAWYDSDLEQYQRDLKENELEKVFTERATNANQTDYSSSVISAVGEHLKQKQSSQPKPEWTESVRQKKNEGYYNTLSKVRKPLNEILNKCVTYRRISNIAVLKYKFE